MEFGFTFKADFPRERTISLTRQAERAGFTYGWTFDSHVLWQECYPLLTMMALCTERMRFGTLVTNPLVRTVDVTASALATLNNLSGGRMVLGMGRGDSSRRVLGKKPATVAQFKQAALDIRDMVAGKEVQVDGGPVHIEWSHWKLPLWLAGYGPKVCRAIGEVADGIILQFADPELIRWCLGFVREGCEAAGRDFSQFQVMAAAPVWISGNLPEARQIVKWFPAMVGNHVADLIARYDPKDLPEALTAYVAGREGYDYRHHADKDADHLDWITDDIVDRFSMIGTPEQQARKLWELQDAGVTQFNIYLMCGEEEKILEIYGNEIVPAFQNA